ncbi:17578_t:CDS:2, partial [Cetraspora pellucida]
IKRTPNQSDIEETYDNIQNSFYNNVKSVDSDNDNTEENAPNSNNLTTTDSSQDSTTTTDPTFSQYNTTLIKKILKKRKSALMQVYNTNIKVIDHYQQSTIVSKNNVSSLVKNCLYFSVRKSNIIEKISKMFEHSTQVS